jgi:hypothetical protein
MLFPRLGGRGLLLFKFLEVRRIFASRHIPSLESRNQLGRISKTERLGRAPSECLTGTYFRFATIIPSYVFRFAGIIPANIFSSHH